MPEQNKGTVTEATDTAAPTPTEVLEGFGKVVLGNSDPSSAPGEPEEAKAVETDGGGETPEAKTETPAKEPAQAKEKDAPAKPVNFDGFSDSQKATFQRLLDAGHVTPEEIEDARRASLRQDLFSKKTATLAREREAFAKEMETRKEDLALLDRIRSDERLHAAWLKASRGEIAAEESAGDDDYVDGKKARQIYRDERSAEAKAEDAKQAKYAEQKEALEGVVQEQYASLSVSPEVMNGYLAAIAKTLPEGVDPVTYLRPDELRDRIVTRHEAAQAKAEAEKLRQQVEKRTSHEARTSKQSLPPARREVQNGRLSAWDQMKADLGIGPGGWTGVTGSGFGNRPQ